MFKIHKLDSFHFTARISLPTDIWSEQDYSVHWLFRAGLTMSTMLTLLTMLTVFLLLTDCSEQEAVGQPTCSKRRRTCLVQSRVQ